MTKRIILTNKETGQVLPEATQLNEAGDVYELQFEGTTWTNVFAAKDWSAEYPVPPVVRRNGDVLRRKDRDKAYVTYVFKEKWWSVSSGTTFETREDAFGFRNAMSDPDNWELV